MKDGSTFNNEMLLIARHARGLSQEEVVERIKVLRYGTYLRTEAGLRVPTAGEVDAFAKGLGYRRTFFFLPFRRWPMPVMFHGTRPTLSKRDCERIWARAEVYRICLSTALKAARLPPEQARFPSIEPGRDSQSASEIARRIRNFLGLPRGPVPDMTRVLEAAGMVVVPFDFGTDVLDGFTQRAQDDLPSLIFVNSRQPKERLRCTLAHEIGHVVMHGVSFPGMKGEANAFAAEFLMPSDDIRPDLRSTDIDHLLMLKGKWRVPVASLIERAKGLGLLTEAESAARKRELSWRGWRTKDPVALPDHIEMPKTVGRLRDTYAETLGCQQATC